MRQGRVCNDLATVATGTGDGTSHVYEPASFDAFDGQRRTCMQQGGTARRQMFGPAGGRARWVGVVIGGAAVSLILSRCTRSGTPPAGPGNSSSAPPTPGESAPTPSTS